MDNLPLKGHEFPFMILESLIELHAKQTAQVNLLIDFLSEISNKSSQELIDSIQQRTELAKKDFVTKLYSEYGDLPPDIKIWLQAKI